MIRSVSSSAALRPTSGLAPAPKPLGELGAELQFCRRLTKLQRLHIRIGGDELDALDFRADHAVDGVAATAADADNFNFCALLQLFAEGKANSRILWSHVPPSYCRQIFASITPGGLGSARHHFFDPRAGYWPANIAFNPADQCCGALRGLAARLRPVDQQTNAGGIFRLGKFFG